LADSRNVIAKIVITERIPRVSNSATPERESGLELSNLWSGVYMIFLWFKLLLVYGQFCASHRESATFNTYAVAAIRAAYTSLL
jgi:hypothetical protein